MKIGFEVDGKAGSYERSSFTGRAVLRWGEEECVLASPWNPRTHFSAATTRAWQAQLGGHDFVVQKDRPQVAAAVRHADFIITVDGRVLATGRGV